jgi:tyrosine decarboxylase/aspartate 1-decarboxylase
MQFWKKLTAEERKSRIKEVLDINVDFSKDASLGYPASKLDGKVFYDDAPFLKEALVLQTYVANPNNIGCHTFGTSEKAFSGTQEIEREVLNVIAVDIFKATPNEFDGYISPGGTEANIMALWMFRNYFINHYQASSNEIVVLASEDTHYSIPKGVNLMQLDWIKIPIQFNNRAIDKSVLESLVVDAKNAGKKYFIVVVQFRHNNVW